MGKNQLKTILVQPDTHVPYEDKRAFSLMLKVAKDIRPDIWVSLGDFLDLYTVSSHSKDPARSLKLDFEIEEANQVLDRIDALKIKRKVFIAGNHEDRLERYLRDKAPELFNMVSVQKLLKLKKRKWEYVPYKTDIKIGKVYYTHDVGVAGRYTAHKALDSYQHCVISGHTHRMSYLVEGSAVGDRHVSMTPGWLGDVESIDYMHRIKAARDWSLGFSVGYLDEKTGNTYFTPVPIVNYTCVVNGKLYRG